MTNSMISVRIPCSLVEELRVVSKRDHFMDLSEAVRSIIRNKWLAERDPVGLKLERLRKDISENISKVNQEALIAELERIKDSIMESKNG